jgi:hypothetical protein
MSESKNAVREEGGPFCEDCGKPIDAGAMKWADDVWTCAKCSALHAEEFSREAAE